MLRFVGAISTVKTMLEVHTNMNSLVHAAPEQKADTVRSCSIVILAVLIELNVRHSLLINVDSIVVTINLSVGVVVAGMDVAATP